ncbi:hypothetical protein A2U01_0002872 [Trifolium medium]|uniref:Uncharacterized protein n=1 Tax=Trifolium medium TaxID=97028 RepID=A0A392M421_9FABA|nr:hypothetical protein [Trifolium medium]
MCQNQYNKIEDDEEDLLEQLEVRKHKEQLERIKKLQEEEEIESKEEKAQTTRLEVMMIQFRKTIGEHMKSSKSEIQHLAEEMSKIKEQCQAIELRNRKVDIVEKSKQGKKSKANETQDTQIQGMNEPEDMEEFDERVEPTEEREPLIQEIPQSTQTPPPVQTTPISPIIVQPYPLRNEKKEVQKEIDRKIDGYLTKTEINVPLKDLLQIAPPFN